MNCECYARINENDERAEIWKEIVPDLRVPLKHPIMEGSYYMGDPKRLSTKQKEILVKLVSEKFRVNKDTIYSDLNNDILPILAKDLSVSICRMHVLCML